MGMHNPAHPGEILKELVIDSLGLSVTDAEHWLRRQHAFDLWQARRHSCMIHVLPIPAHAV